MAEELSAMDRAKDAFLELLATLEGDELLSFETFVGAAVGMSSSTIYAPAGLFFLLVQIGIA